MASRYTVRIQLHEEKQGSKAYKLLDVTMAKGGFLRWFENGGKYWRLPHAEYVGAPKKPTSIESLTADIQVLAAAVLRKEGIDGKARVFVTKQAGTAWVGLEPASPIYHRLGTSRKAFCEKVVEVSNILADEAEAHRKAATLGGAACVKCWP
jgi:hypothetical protein